MKARLLIPSFMALGLIWSTSSFAVAYKIDSSKSSVQWAAYKVVEALGGHNGSIKIKEGTLDLGGKEAKGRFVIDMKSIEALDLKDKPDLKGKLEKHLNSEDFFGVDKHPEAVFVLKKWQQDPKDKVKYQVDGELTIKGTTGPLSIPAEVIEKNGNLQISSTFTIQRNLWNIRYNSPTFFDIKTLGDKAIKDEVEFKIEMLAVKK
ncbi:MAG: YceI family protein [Oligoflexus sp.]|jgi:polyisoprenoid-binding protein YceI